MSRCEDETMPVRRIPKGTPLPLDHPLRRGAIVYTVQRPPPPEKTTDTEDAGRARAPTVRSKSPRIVCHWQTPDSPPVDVTEADDRGDEKGGR